MIASDLIFTAEDPSGLLFALISSSMFITWQKTIGGRLESRLRFSNTVVWNNFPVPVLDDSTREKIIKAGNKIQEVRNNFPEYSLAELYAPLGMKPELKKAHYRCSAA